MKLELGEPDGNNMQQSGLQTNRETDRQTETDGRTERDGFIIIILCDAPNMLPLTSYISPTTWYDFSEN